MDESINYTLWCGNIDSEVTQDLLYELFLQAGPLENVKIAVDNATGKNKSFAFITFKHMESVPYTMNLMNGIRLFGQTLKLQARPGSVHEQTFQQQQYAMRHSPAITRQQNTPNLMQLNPMTSPPGQFNNRVQPPTRHPFDNQVYSNGSYGRSYGSQSIRSSAGERQSRSDRYVSSSSQNRVGSHDRGPRDHDDRYRDRSGGRTHGGSAYSSSSSRDRDNRGSRDYGNNLDMRRQSVLNMQQRNRDINEQLSSHSNSNHSRNRYDNRTYRK